MLLVYNKDGKPDEVFCAFMCGLILGGFVGGVAVGFVMSLFS